MRRWFPGGRNRPRCLSLIDDDDDDDDDKNNSNVYYPVQLLIIIADNIITIIYTMAYGNRRFNAIFTKALQQPLSGAQSTQFLALTPISLRSILICYLNF